MALAGAEGYDRAGRDRAARQRRRAVRVVLYQNPFKPKQAFETIAYGFAIQPNGDRYFLTVVDTAASKTAIDASSDDFLAVLKGL
jgi:hypothetical protein